jgi:hypothetical protein
MGRWVDLDEVMIFSRSVYYLLWYELKEYGAWMDLDEVMIFSRSVYYLLWYELKEYGAWMAWRGMFKPDV